MLEIRVLGHLEVVRDGTPIALPPSKKTRALLGYLVTTGRQHRRDRLCSLLWDVADDPRGGLRWSVSKLRGLLDEPDAARVLADRETVAFMAQGAVIDLVAARDGLGPDLDSCEVAALEAALGCFRGELLEELELPELHDFQAWLYAEREHARALRRDLARALTTRWDQQPARALPYARLWVELEPNQPEPRVALIRLLGQAGHEREAQEQFELGARLFKERGGTALEALHAVRRALRDTPSSSPPTTPSAATTLGLSAARSVTSPTLPPPKPQHIRFCRTADGVLLAFASVGEGPPIVKTGNWITHLEQEWSSPVWSHVLHELSSYRTLVRYDQRGNGMSDWEVPNFSFEHMVSDLETVIEAAGLDRFALLGISQGCAVSIAYAVRHPERVTHLVLHGGYPRGWRSWSKNADVEGAAMMTLMESGWGRENPAFRQYYTSRFIPSATQEQMQWFNELQRISATGKNAARLMDALGNVDVRELLAQVRVPTLVTHCSRDALAPFSQGKQLAAGIPGARLLPLESDNHLVLASEPAWHVLRAAIREFLGQDA